MKSNGTLPRLLLLAMFTTLVNPGEINYIRCMIGHEVDFNYPDCPENLYRLKKLPGGVWIVRDGILNQLHPRYSFKEQKTRLRLKECNENDEGKYLWFCEKYNVTEQIYLEINKPPSDEKLHCTIGHEVSFKCPCCPEELESCRFKKLLQKGYIFRDDEFNNLRKSTNQNKYWMDPGKTQITLKECDEDDEGTYVWMCGRCNVNKQFYLQVQQAEVTQKSSTAKISQQSTTFLSLCSFFFLHAQTCFLINKFF